MIKRKRGRPRTGRSSEIPGFHSWKNMRMRCMYEKHNAFPYYGGRGIQVCERWNSFRSFIEDMGPKPPGTTLDRIDTNKNYEPSNCRWVSMAVQNTNKRCCHYVTDELGNKVNLSEFAKRHGLLPDTVRYRMKNKIPLLTGDPRRNR